MEKKGGAAIIIVVIIGIIAFSIGIYLWLNSGSVFIEKTLGPLSYVGTNDEGTEICNFISTGQEGCKTLSANYDSTLESFKRVTISNQIYPNTFTKSQADSGIKTLLTGWGDPESVQMKNRNEKNYYFAQDVNEFLFSWATKDDVILISIISLDGSSIEVNDFSIFFDAYMEKYPSIL
jgi:hypothetical protein